MITLLFVLLQFFEKEKLIHSKYFRVVMRVRIAVEIVLLDHVHQYLIELLGFFAWFDIGFHDQIQIKKYYKLSCIYRLHFCRKQQSNMKNHLESQLEQTIPVRESQNKRYNNAAIGTSQIHYVTVPLRLTLSTSPSASQTRPLEVQFNQIQNHHIIQPYFQDLPVSKVRRNRIFADQEFQQFTPRRKIFVESKCSASIPYFDRDNRNNEKKSIQIEIQHEHIQKGNIQKRIQLGQMKEQLLESNPQKQNINLENMLNNAEKQIMQQFPDHLYYLTQVKQSQSFSCRLHNQTEEDIFFNEAISVQIKANNQFHPELNFSPIAARRITMPLEEQLFFDERKCQTLIPQRQKNISQIYNKQQQNGSKIGYCQNFSFNKRDQIRQYCYLAIIGLLISYLIFQIIK